MDIHRYLSQVIIPELGIEGQQKINSSSVLVVGAGGLGCPVLLYLSGLGVGNIGIIDHDVVNITNLHRQVLYTEMELGRLKAVIASEKLRLLNSELTITPYPEKLTGENASTITSNYDIVVDCSDNIETRYLIDATTFAQQKPFVYGGVRRFEGQVSVFNYKGSPRFSDVFPDKEQWAGSLNCSEAGIVGFTVGLVGCLQVNEVTKIILNTADTLAGYMLTVDLQTMVMRKWKLNR